VDIQQCAWDDCGDVADYVLRFAEGNQRVGVPLAVCVVHLADGIVGMFERLQLEGPGGGVVQVEPAA
jgi:hypothetical protein